MHKEAALKREYQDKRDMLSALNQVSPDPSYGKKLEELERQEERERQELEI